MGMAHRMESSLTVYGSDYKPAPVRHHLCGIVTVDRGGRGAEGGLCLTTTATM